MEDALVLSGDFRKTRLDNGLRIVTEQIPFVQSVSLGIWVKAGSRNEEKKEHGISHFLEHMLFKGTEKRNAFEIVNSLESLGGELDAFTSRDHTCFYARCLAEHIDVALDVLIDMLQNPKLDLEDIEKEKRVILEEIHTVEDTPEEFIHDLFSESVWGGHPVGGPILGNRNTVVSITRDNLRTFLNHYYQANRIVISVAGKINHDHLVEMVDRQFCLYESKSSQAFNALIECTDQTTQHHYSRDIRQTHICLGTTACGYTHPGRFDLLIANTALGEGMSSRLFQQVRERLGLAYTVYSFLEILEDTGLFGTYLACDSTRVDQATEIAFKEIFKLKNNGISIKELESSKAQLKGEMIIGLESMDRRMGRIAYEEIYTREYQSAEESLKAIDRVTQKSVIDACLSFLDEDKMHQITLGP